MDLALNNLQWLICHKTKPNQTKPKPILSYCNYLTEVIFVACQRTKCDFSPFSGTSTLQGTSAPSSLCLT